MTAPTTAGNDIRATSHGLGRIGQNLPQGIERPDRSPGSYLHRPPSAVRDTDVRPTAYDVGGVPARVVVDLLSDRGDDVDAENVREPE